MRPLQLALTDHVEGPADRHSREAYDSAAEIAIEADRLGVEYAWFSEHHAHAHHGHLPAPLLFALHLAGRTRRIRLGTAIICLNLHHPLAIAEQVAVSDVLAGGRMAVGFGSGSSPEEFRLFGLEPTVAADRHERFAEALRVILVAWGGDAAAWSGIDAKYFDVPQHRMLPNAATDLRARSWLAVNSVGSARIAGALGFNMMFSHLRTPQQYREYRAEYEQAGGHGMAAANRPVYVGADDAAAWREVEPALRTLWRRFRDEGKVPASAREPSDVTDLAGHPINFVVGGPSTVARQISQLRAEAPFDVLNAEVHWAELPMDRTLESLRRLATEVRAELDTPRDA